MTLLDAPDPRLSATRIAGKPALVLKSSEFRKGREEGWRELETLVGHVERRGVRLLSLYELQRLPILYRAALSSLSVARTIALDRNLLLYLENLALRAFLVVYGPRISPLRRHADVLPARSAGGGALGALAHPLATLALLVGVAAGFMLTLQDEAWFSSSDPGRDGRRPRAREHARPSSTTRSCLRPRRAHSRHSACSPTCCSATIRWSAS